MKSKSQLPISRIVIMGDSLSDRGTMNNRKLFGMIPMSYVSGLAQTSPKGRFTNGFPWSDAFCAIVNSKFRIDDIKDNTNAKKKFSKFQDNTDIADAVLHRRMVRRFSAKWDSTDTSDAIIAEDFRIAKDHSYKLNDNKNVRYDGLNFVTSYVEGGLTASDYSWMPSSSLTRFFSRIILATLESMRNQLLEDDQLQSISIKQKAETLVIEWSGANDLITVNAIPSKEEVDDAIHARIENMTQLIKNGYRHFVLINLPNLALTPRYQQKSDGECNIAAYYSDYFNRRLAIKCKKLQQNFPYCSIKIFDANKLFTDIYTHPEKMGFDKDKLATPFVNSPEFSIQSNKTSPAKGFMFFDDLHPTADLHEEFANALYHEYSKYYRFTKPKIEALHLLEEPIKVDAASLISSFRSKYEKVLNKDKAGFFGLFCRTNINVKVANLEDILRHAIYEGGERTRRIIMDLQWIDKKGNICLNIPALTEAMNNVTTEMNTLSSS